MRKSATTERRPPGVAGNGFAGSPFFAALWWPCFRLQAALRWREISGAAALVDGEAGKGVILEVNAAAASSWVEPGLTTAQALARCPELRVILRSAAQEAAGQALLVELALEFSPRVEATAPGLGMLDLSGAAKGACWQRLGEEMVARCAEQGFAARVGMAPHPEHAWLAACGGSDGSDRRLGQPSRPDEGGDGAPRRATSSVQVVYDGASFCAALPVSALGPSNELGAVLQDWGIRTVGEFMRLPAEQVVERLGAEAGELRRRVNGRTRRVLRLVRPAERYVEAFDFDYAIETTEPLLFLLRRFADGLAARLRAGHRVARELRLALPMETGPEYARTFSIPAPTADAEVWFRILSTHLEMLILAQQPVGVRLEAEADDAAGRQLNLFESALRDPNRFGETLAQLKAVVGDGSVGVPQPADSHRPGAFRMKEFSEAVGEEEGDEGRRGLPLRRNRAGSSALVREVNGCPVWLDGPMAAVRGPYELSGAWWDQKWKIVEWDVQTSDGRLLRLAKWPDETWTVEGAYDVL